MGHEPGIRLEIRKVDGDLDRLAELVVAQPIPEVLKPELTVPFGQSGIQDQLKGEEQVALPDLVFSDDDDVTTGWDLEIGEIRKIYDPDFADAHSYEPLDQIFFE
ncbi:hypothetical protein GGR33_003133 [Methylobacterium brachythecii]|uniref:Uncharacterized protein n=1 Tax=Methylobacterium brachythecii TaxID=1176177 RepID=A0A7W6AKY7_9HYPH|nr:hypothetical protein [Methylobacterium brachythecii]MBB3903624.1 hypothetical protein [Methylobacterium brachythecii]GLS44193.1 hypothetical protein GCM10007884_21810 [Methylobacterium brachythecii]